MSMELTPNPFVFRRILPDREPPPSLRGSLHPTHIDLESTFAEVAPGILEISLNGDQLVETASPLHHPSAPRDAIVQAVTQRIESGYYSHTEVSEKLADLLMGIYRR